MKIYKQGDTIRHGVKIAQQGTGEPVSLTGCTAYSQMRSIPGGDLAAEGTVSIDIARGRVIVEYTMDQTAALEPGEYGYDIRLESVWNTTGPDGYHIDDPNLGWSGRDVHTLYTTRIKIVKPYTEMED